MTLNIDLLQKKMCGILCADVRISAIGENIYRVATPFSFSDGDAYQIYIREMPNGVLRMSDCGHTFMRLSYENDMSKMREGIRNKIINSILADGEIKEEDGEFFVDFIPDEMAQTLFRFGQTLTRVTDISFLNKTRGESTFYSDLYESITNLVGKDKIEKDFILPELPDAQNYPVDFRISDNKSSLFLFGIPNRDKARLATIILGKFLIERIPFESILVFSDQTQIPRNDLARLSNVGGEMVASLDAQEDLSRKVFRRLGMSH
jgi:hypothetical protein